LILFYIPKKHSGVNGSDYYQAFAIPVAQSTTSKDLEELVHKVVSNERMITHWPGTFLIL